MSTESRQGRKAKNFRQLAENTSSPLYAYLRHGRELARLDRLLDGALTENERPHCRVANFSGDTLVLNTDTSAWAARLRFSAPDLLEQLRRHRPLASLRRIHFRVGKQAFASPNDPGANGTRPVKPLRELSDSARTLIGQLADGVRDEEIRAALKRLANRDKAR